MSNLVQARQNIGGCFNALLQVHQKVLNHAQRSIALDDATLKAELAKLNAEASLAMRQSLLALLEGVGTLLDVVIEAQPTPRANKGNGKDHHA